MNKLILCEGKTDAILLSYYLEATCNWTHRKVPKSYSIKADELKGESAYWYCKDNDNLLICGVGGKNRFSAFFREKIVPIMIDSTGFSKIAVVTDRDDHADGPLIQSFQATLQPIVTSIHNNIWTRNQYINSYKELVSFEFLLLIIPADKEGALETLLLDAISENEYDKPIVEKSAEFIERIQPIASKYIHKSRLKLKACLGVTWAIQYPEKIFSFIDNQIRSVKWEDSQILSQCFEQLRNI